jgi:hypothetical protein
MVSILFLTSVVEFRVIISGGILTLTDGTLTGQKMD